MKNLTRVVVMSVLFLGFLFTTNSMAEAATTYYPAGCTATTAYSPLSGQKCYPGSVLGESVVSDSPSVTVLSPNGGEVFQVGQTITIKWTGYDTVNNSPYQLTYLQLVNSSDGKISIVAPQANTTVGLTDSYTFTIPSSGPDIGIIGGNDYKIYLALSSANSSFYKVDLSDNLFTINSSQNTACVINSFTANPSTVTVAGRTILSWSTNGCNNIYIDNQITTNTSNGSQDMPVQGWPGTHTFKLSASAVILPGCTPMNGYAGNGVNGQLCSSTAQFSSVNVNVIDLDPTPRIAYWWGKVNQHVDDHGNWLTDPDGVSGADLDKLTYCKKWYPDTTSTRDYRKETLTGWRERGNVGGPYTLEVMTIECVRGTTTSAITVTSPNGGEVYPLGQQINVTWTTTNIPADARMSVSISDGSTPGNSAIVPNTGSFLYDASAFPAGVDYKAHVSLGVTTPITDESDSPFTIGPKLTFCNKFSTPSITVLSPNGGETYTAGQRIEVKWKSCNLSKNQQVFIDIWNPSMTNMYRLGQTINDGTEVFTIPSVANWANMVYGRNFIINILTPIEYVGQVNYSDSSDNLFTINGTQTNCTINSFTANPTTVNSGGMSTLSWTTTGCNNASLDSSNVAVNGSGVSGPHTQTTTYTLYAGTLYQGCNSFAGYSSTNGQPCSTGAQTATVTIGVTNTTYPAGCTSPLGYSPTTGMMCTFPTVTWMPGCTSAQGYSSTNGQSCNWTTVYPGVPQGCSSTSGFSATTGQMCLGGKVQNPGIGNIISEFNKTLKIGSRGEMVKKIQELLGIGADGVYGKGTAQKVKEWQAKNGLKADGAFGAKSWTILNSGQVLGESIVADAISVDLKVNGSDNPSAVEYRSQVTVTWTSTGSAGYTCSASGAPLPYTDLSRTWTGFPSGANGIATSGSTNLIAAYATSSNFNNLQYYSSAEITIQCIDNNSNEVTDSVILPIITNTITTPTAGIRGKKVVCQSEADLPNLSNGDTRNILEWDPIANAYKVGSDTARKWVEGSNGRCKLADGWNFEWAGVRTSNPNVYTTNPGDNLASGGTGWNAFGPTDTNGGAGVTAPVDEVNKIFWVREQMKPGYTQYSGSNTNNVSAEMYCYFDVHNTAYNHGYDNFSKVYFGDVYYGLIKGANWYQDTRFDCVSFNAVGSSLKLLAPNGGEQYSVGQSMIVKWENTNIPTSGVRTEVNLFRYNATTGVQYQTAIPILGTTNSQDYTIYVIPQTYMHQMGPIDMTDPNVKWKAQVIIYSSNGAIIAQDESDGFFTIGKPSDTTCSANSTPSITVISPNGGETYTAGQQVTVKWKSCNIPERENVRIDLVVAPFPPMGTNGQNLANTLNDGIEIVTLPQSSQFNGNPMSFGTNFKVSIWRSNGLSSTIDQSDNLFTINGPTNTTCNSSTTPFVRWISPNGGESYTEGQQITVRWESCNIPASEGTKINLKPVIYQGNYIPINTPNIFPLNSGSATFTLPSRPSSPQMIYGNYYKFHIDYPGLALDGDDSDNFFTINSNQTQTCHATNPSITLLSPAGETYTNGDSITIRWSSCNIPANAPIQIIFNGMNGGPSGAFAMGSTATANDGSETFLLPPPPISNPLPAGMYQVLICQDNGGPGECVGTFSNPGTFNIVLSRTAFTKTLKIGSRGEEVKAIQKLLNIKADGIYGRGTANRVKAWQLSNALKPDGVFGPASWAKIK